MPRTIAWWRGASVDAVDEGAVDLHDAHRQVLHVRERRVPGTEVVDRERDPEIVELAEPVAFAFLVHRDERLGELEREAQRLRVDALAREQLARSSHTRFGSASWRGERLTLRFSRCSSGRRRFQRGDRRARLGEHPFADRDDRTGALRELEELAGTEQPALRMLPAQQRLDADGAAGRDLDDRLVVEAQLVTVERMRERGLGEDAVARRGARRAGRTCCTLPAAPCALAKYIAASASLSSASLVVTASSSDATPMLADIGSRSLAISERLVEHGVDRAR